MSLKGSPELRARLRALKLAFKPVGKAWGQETVTQARRRVRKKTGATAASFRVRNNTQRKTVVVGSYIANFIDADVKAHDETGKPVMRFTSRQGRTIFSRKVHKPRHAGSHFKRAAALEALRLNPMAAEVIRQWNEAAR